MGSGPSAFYAAEALFKQPGLEARVDMIDRMPFPFGLVRGGVAPDHQKIKGVVEVYEKIAEHEGFRFFGNVRVGRDVAARELGDLYHMVVWAVGCESDMKLGIPGEELEGVHSATEFVGWYNAHPDHRERIFDLAGAERAAIVGNGNVAMDVARILLRDPETLASTDIADHALEALRRSRVREVVLLGRRGPAQAAFSPKELEEIAALKGVHVAIEARDAAPDPLSAQWLEERGTRSAKRNAELIASLASRPAPEPPRRLLRCRFLTSPVAIGGERRLSSVTLRRQELALDSTGTPRPKPTDEVETIDVDLLFKAIGYRGVPVEGMPFDERRGIFPTEGGRLLREPGGAVMPGHYAVGWCKRGPSGLIGTNSLDSKATVEAMMEDLKAGAVPRPQEGDLAEILRERGIDAVSWEDWARLDAWEQEQGRVRGKARHKQASVEELMATIRALRPGS
ncbi:MAG: FAD-dependent oxidoreductase [Planctomycetota bacterium]